MMQYLFLVIIPGEGAEEVEVNEHQEVLLVVVEAVGIETGSPYLFQSF